MAGRVRIVMGMTPDGAPVRNRGIPQDHYINLAGLDTRTGQPSWALHPAGRFAIGDLPLGTIHLESYCPVKLDGGSHAR